MNKDVRFYYKKNWAWGWGIFLLLVAGLVLSNHFGGFMELSVWSIIVTAFAVAFMIQCIIDFSFGLLPIPIAALYWIFQTPLDLPHITFWPLVLVTVLATGGLSALIPKRKRLFKKGNIGFVFAGDDGEGNMRSLGDEGEVKESGGDNNPSISVQFGSVSRYLHADCLETVELDCSFGALEVYFDHAELSPNGAEVFLNCKFGAIELYVPSHWRIINNMNASLGGVSVKGRHNQQNEDAPTLKLIGNVSLGGVEVHRI